MSGFLGTAAPLIADLTQVTMLLLGLWVVAGFIQARRRAFPVHCRWMAWIPFVAYVPIIVGMVPAWLGLARLGSALFAQPVTTVPFMHGIVSGVAQLLMTYTVVRMNWRRKWPPRRPLWLMRISLALWLLAIVGGSGVYLLLYG